MSIQLTEGDYDALFAVMQADMPRMWREFFPRALSQLEDLESRQEPAI